MVRRILVISVVLNLLLLFASIYLYGEKEKALSSVGNKEKVAASKVNNEPVEAQSTEVYVHPNYYNQTNLYEVLQDSQGGIVFFGDSITAGNQWGEFFPGKTIKNRGIGSEPAYRMVERLNSVVNIHPEKFFIMAGINDLSEGRTVDEVVESFSSILNTMSQQSPDTKVFIQSVLPVNKLKFNPTIATNEQIASLNSKLAELSKEYNATFINLYPLFLDGNQQLNEKYTFDGLHVNGEGYAIWINQIKELVEQ